MFRELLQLFAFFFFVAAAGLAWAQATDDAVRVTVTMNSDGSKTVYQTNPAERESIAVTTGADGKTLGKIMYRLDAEGRYESGQVFAANGTLRFKTLYKYDSSGRLAEERQMAKDGSALHRIVYSFDEAGHQNGYAIYDGVRRLLGRVNPKTTAQKNTKDRRR